MSGSASHNDDKREHKPEQERGVISPNTSMNKDSIEFEKDLAGKKMGFKY